MNCFKDYKEICTLITEYEYKIFTLKERLYSVSGVRYDDMPKCHGRSDDMVFKLQEIDELVEELNALKEKKKELYNKHIQEISLVNNSRQRSVLRMYYLLEMNVDDIKTVLDIQEKNSVYRLLRKGVQELIKIQNDTK